MRSLFVSSEGDFYPCEKLYDYDDMLIGNIDTGFDMARIAEIITEYASNTIDDCNRCWAYRLCGECFLSIRSNKTWDKQKRREYCNGQRNMWMNLLSIYTSILEKNRKAFDYFIDTKQNEYIYIKEMMK
jgi:uncharacterized protein